uniref:Uncharacterized protein n=1 Tax=Rhizophora mucronata TaxID=61149 RepID=A0A2P2NKE6_RHIMU
MSMSSNTFHNGKPCICLQYNHHLFCLNERGMVSCYPTYGTHTCLYVR